MYVKGKTIISIKILDKEYEQCVKKVERLQEEMEIMQSRFHDTKLDLEEQVQRMQDLKTAISKLKEQ